MVYPTQSPEIWPASQSQSLTDGTLDAIVLAPCVPAGNAALLPVGLPAKLRQQHASGRYFLARCGAQTVTERLENWQIYLRRPLFASRLQPQLALDHEEAGFDQWDLRIPPGRNPGHAWLRARSPGDTVNLMGPLGNGFALPAEARHLLALTDPDRLTLLLPLVDAMLDRGGRVSVMVRDPSGANPMSLLALLPLAVEVQFMQAAHEWQRMLDETVRWADQICAALPGADHLTLAETIRRRRFRLEPGFAQMLVEADLVCGTGACLACVVPTANGGVTRTCVHGPVLDLTRLVE